MDAANRAWSTDFLFSLPTPLFPCGGKKEVVIVAKRRGSRRGALFFFFPPSPSPKVEPMDASASVYGIAVRNPSFFLPSEKS